MKTHHTRPTPKARKEQLAEEEALQQIKEARQHPEDEETPQDEPDQDQDDREPLPNGRMPMKPMQRPYSRPQAASNPSLDDMTAMKGLKAKESRS